MLGFHVSIEIVPIKTVMVLSTWKSSYDQNQRTVPSKRIQFPGVKTRLFLPE